MQVSSIALSKKHKQRDFSKFRLTTFAAIVRGSLRTERRDWQVLALRPRPLPVGVFKFDGVVQPSFSSCRRLVGWTAPIPETVTFCCGGQVKLEVDSEPKLPVTDVEQSAVKELLTLNPTLLAGAEAHAARVKLLQEQSAEFAPSGEKENLCLTRP